jgi:UDP-N-acetylglucosamine 4,6-dehydratase
MGKNFKIFIFITLAAFILPNYPNHDLFENKTILVIGGTGYLGQAIVQEVLKYNPLKVIIFSRDELKHFNSSRALNNPKIVNIIGDIRDYESILHASRGVDIVFHVAALKRMDILESNVFEAVKTNILGSLNIFSACVINKVDKMLFISTDKACSPINTYGASKFISEKIFTHYDKKRISTKFMAVRFGNILESTGSVIPFFTEKIQKGEDIPLTDERMTRFIINKEEAVNLIFNALRYGMGGEIFIKKLPALKVTDLIEILKRKYKAHNAIKIIGLRPGEKIHESLINESEIVRTIEFNDCFIIQPSINQTSAYTENPPIYLIHGKLVETSLQDYSSQYEVISQEALAALFSKLGLL